MIEKIDEKLIEYFCPSVRPICYTSDLSWLEIVTKIINRTNLNTEDIKTLINHVNELEKLVHNKGKE